MKTCNKCGFEKPLEEFHKNYGWKDGRHNICKVCRNALKKVQDATYRERNPDAYRASLAKWRETHDRKLHDAKYRELHREECNQRTYSNRAMREQYFVEEVDRKIVFNRDKGICHICKETCDSKDWHLDHVMPVSKGGLHCYDNVAVSHSSCNLKKGNKINTFGLTEEIKEIYDYEEND